MLKIHSRELNNNNNKDEKIANIPCGICQGKSQSKSEVFLLLI